MIDARPSAAGLRLCFAVVAALFTREAHAACDFEQNSIWRKLKIGATSVEIAALTKREVYCSEHANTPEIVARNGGTKCFLRPQAHNMRSLTLYFDSHSEDSILDGKKTILTLKAASFHDCDQRFLGPRQFFGK